MQLSARREPGWQLTQASARGKAHVDSGLPNQDWIEVRTSPDATVIAAAISDGAGSAARSHIGARETCERMAPCMLEIGLQMQHAPLRLEEVRERITRALEAARASLAGLGGDLADFHCTLAMCVLTERGGYVCQVGDSVALSTAFASTQSERDPELDFFPDASTRLFEPDRGEYANETHFVTEGHWTEHLRIREIEAANVDALLLMTDGAMDVAMVRGRVFRGFLSNLIGKLITLPEAATRDRLLGDWLDDPRTFRATADDKTMFVAIRAEHRHLAGQPFLVDPILSEDAPPKPRIHKAPPPPPPPTRPWWQQLIEPPFAPVVGSCAVVVALLLFPFAFKSSLTPEAASKPVNTAELIFVPDDAVLLELAANGAGAVRLRMIGGKKVELLSVNAVPAGALQVIVDEKNCPLRRPITVGSPDCVIRLQARSPAQATRYALHVDYRDQASGQVRKLSLPVRASAGGQE